MLSLPNITPILLYSITSYYKHEAHVTEAAIGTKSETSIFFGKKKKEKPAKLLLENLGINKKLNSMVFHLQLSIFILDS